MVAIEFAAEFKDDQEVGASRLAGGPPKVETVSGARAGEKRTQWQLGKCRGCTRDIEGGKVVEAAGGKWHSTCFCCTQCQLPLAGVKQKKEEAGRIFCNPCWVELYAPTCFVCKTKIDGDRMRKGDQYRHPKCKPTNISAKSKPVAKPAGGRNATRAKGKPNMTSAHMGMNAMSMGYANLE